MQNHIRYEWSGQGDQCTRCTIASVDTIACVPLRVCMVACVPLRAERSPVWSVTIASVDSSLALPKERSPALAPGP